MAKLKRLSVSDYKMLSKKIRYIDDATDIFNGEIANAIAYLQGILTEGFTHMSTEKWIENEYGHEYAECKTQYFKVREETDEEYENRCKQNSKRKEQEKLRKEAREKVLQTLTPEQVKALGPWA